MKTGRWILGGAVLAGVAIGAWWFLRPGSEAEIYVSVPVRRGAVASAVAATGTVNPVITVLVGSQISGQVAELFADFNSIVKKGQIIARLDDSNLQAQVSRDRANLASARANLERAKVEADNAQRAFSRAKRLEAQALIPDADYDAAESEAAASAASVRTAQAAVDQAGASLKISEVTLERATILSPVDGVVISRDVDVGQTVAASLQAPTLFTIAQDLRLMEVHMNVAESDIGRLQVGQDATFTVDAYPQDRFSGTISEIRNAPTTIQNVVTYEAVIKVNNDDLRLKPGMTANVSVVVARRADVLLIPNAALRFRPPEDLRPPSPASAGSTGEPSRAGGAPGAAASAGQADGAPARSNAGGREARSGRGAGRRGDSGSGPPADREPASSGPQGDGSGAGPRPGARSSREGRSGPIVWTLKSETPRPVSIVVGITDGSWTEVVSGDLTEGDPVITELTAAAAAAAAQSRTQRPGGFGRMF